MGVLMQIRASIFIFYFSPFFDCYEVYVLGKIASVALIRNAKRSTDVLILLFSSGNSKGDECIYDYNR